jgi:hypothetical protein
MLVRRIREFAGGQRDREQREPATTHEATRHSADASQSAAPKAGRKRRVGAKQVMAVQGKVQLYTRGHICIVMVVPPSILAW